MLSRALTRALPSAGMLMKQALPTTPVTQTTILRQTSTQAIRLPTMAYQPLRYLEEAQPQRLSGAEAAAETMASGKLVSDQLVATMLESYLRTSAQDGWVLDGFPRNATQAKMLLSRMETRPDMVIELVVPHEDIRERLLCRRVDPVTGRVYNVAGDMPSEARVIERLEKRGDDCEEVIERRLNLYEESMPGIRSVFMKHDIPVIQVFTRSGASVEEVAKEIDNVTKGKRVVLAGAPGCGKGTQGILLADAIGGEHVSTGDLLRKAARLAREGLGNIVEDGQGIGVVARL